MSRVQVVSDDGVTVIPIVAGTDDEGEAWTTATCPVHGEIEADHSYFEDMVEAAGNHLDQLH